MGGRIGFRLDPVDLRAQLHDRARVLRIRQQRDRGAHLLGGGQAQVRKLPRLRGRLFAGEAGVVMMTELRGASNAKAKRELGWRPAHPSWRRGFTAA